MHIVFADNTLCYNGITPYHNPLGGSQSAAVYMSRGLAELGHTVTYFNNTLGEPREYKGVDYRHISTMTLDSREMPDVDVFIGIRDPRVLLHWEGGGLKLVRMQDDFDQPMVQQFLMPRCRRACDHIIAVSEWQVNRFRKVSGWPKGRISVIPNGFWQGSFSEEFPEKVGNRLAYCSTPFRGLARLLDIFPLIREQVPDAELHVYSDMSVYQYTPEDDQEIYGDTYEKMVDMPGITHHGSIGQRELAKELEKCKVLAYSNIFPETSCIAQLEAQAAGNVVVTTALGALPETIGPHGITIPGFPSEGEYDTDFAAKCIDLLKNEDKWREIAEQARQWAWENHTYTVICKQFEEKLELLVANKGSKRCLL